MHHLLHLTGRETALWERLPSNLREGWAVETDDRAFADSDERRQARLELMRIQDPVLLAFRERLRGMTSWAEFEAAVATVPLQDVSHADLLQLFYGLGPAMIAPMIEQGLSQANADDDIAAVAALSHIRRVLLDAFLPAYA